MDMTNGIQQNHSIETELGRHFVAVSCQQAVFHVDVKCGGVNQLQQVAGGRDEMVFKEQRLTRNSETSSSYLQRRLGPFCALDKYSAPS